MISSQVLYQLYYSRFPEELSYSWIQTLKSPPSCLVAGLEFFFKSFENFPDQASDEPD
jgi:hypothetical protein